MADVSKPDPIVAEARERWNRCDEHEAEQRKRILKAKEFRAGDQWEEAIRNQRSGNSAIQGIGAQPIRPCLTIDRLSAPCRQISNTIKTAQFGFEVLPNGGGADTDTAEIFKGYLRRVQNECRAESPIEWAADQAIEGGLGWFRIRTEYVQVRPGENPDENLFDQEVRLERIANNLTVYCDPSASKPTRSDALYMLVTEDLSRVDFETRWPKADLRGLEEFATTGDKALEWVKEDSIRIAEYWKKTFRDEEWAQLKDGSIVSGKAVPKDAALIKQSRTVRVPVITGYKINAVEILETWDWVGTRIPLIPIIGEELNIDGKVLVRGVIEEGMDAQRMVNYTYSGAMEIFALGPKSPWVVADSQIAQYQPIWQTANIYNHSYLPYTPQDLLGNAVPPPARNVSEPPIQAAVALMAKSEECVKATTGIFDSSLGDVDPKARSGRAIDSLKVQSELTSSNYPQNVARALVYAGECIMEIVPKITRPGQILQILGIDDKPDQVMIGQPYTIDPTTKSPVRAPAGVTPEIAKLSKGLHKFYDLARGQYSVTVVAGKASATRREEGAAALGDLIPHLPPEMAAVATPDYVEQLSFPGAHGIAEQLRKVLPPHLQGKDDENQQIPPQIAAQMQAMQAQMQEMQKVIETDQVKQQATLRKAQMDGETAVQKGEIDGNVKIQLAMIDRQTKLEIANLNAQAGIAEADIAAQSADMDRRLKMVELFLTARQQVQAQEFEAIGSERERGHDAGMAERERGHESEMAEKGHERQIELGERGHEQALEQTELSAALEPDPATEGA